MYSVSKNTDRLGFIHTPNNSVRIASAGEAEQDDQTQFHSEIELEETEEIEIDEELEIMPTPEQLAEPEPEAIESQESDLTTADAVAEEDGESE